MFIALFFVLIYIVIFCVDVKWQISYNLLCFPNFFMALTEHTNFIWKCPFVIVETFKSDSLAVSRHYPVQTFCLVLVLAFVLGNIFVACICAWRHFLGVRLYSDYTIGHWNLERVLCLILPSCFVKSVSSISILCCQPFLQECVSGRGLLHNSERSVFVLK
jgi:hypothetical protein